MANVVQEYISNGWALVIIPPGSKGPFHAGWNLKEGALPSADLLPHGYGVGLMHAYSGTMAFDIDDWERTKAYGIDVDALYAAADAVTIQSGRPGRGKLLYRMPDGLVLPTKKFQDNLGSNPVDGKVIRVNTFELRCGTMDNKTVQDVLPPSIHPDTNNPYTWGGAGHWSRLPMIPDQLMDIWQKSLTDSRPVSADGIEATWDEIREALSYISPDCSRQDWINAGMALQWAGEQRFNPEQAFTIWDGWSRQSTQGKYPGERVMAQQWFSFKTSKNKIVTLGTLFHMARQNGWMRAQYDASALFADVTKMVKPHDVITLMRPTPPDIDLNLFPPALTRRANEVSESVGCDPIVPLWAGLGAVCGAVDARTRLELAPGFLVPPVLWLMTIGDPGDMKSPGSRPMFAPLREIEAADIPRFTQDVLAWEGKEVLYKRAKLAYLEHFETPEALLGAEPPPLPGLPDKPIPLRLYVQDITSQKLVDEASVRPRGLLCYLDEMNSWVQKVTSRTSGEDRSTWVVGYEAERYMMDRVGKGKSHCDNFAISIFGNMQPQVLDDHFESLAQDGLLQRFLPAVLRHEKTRLGEPVPGFLSHAAEWGNTLRRVYALEPTTYRLSDEAYTTFRAFQTWYHERLANERLVRSSNEFMTAFGKITGIAGRLALIFHILENPWSPTVSDELLQRVIKVIKTYVIPCYRYVFDREGSASAFDFWMTEYIIQHAHLERITLRDIKRSAARQFQKANVNATWHQGDWIINAMLLLQKMRWVHRVDDGSKEYQGQAEWLVNPNLKTVFAEYRNTVVRIKLERNQYRLDTAKSALPNIIPGMDALG